MDIYMYFSGLSNILSTLSMQHLNPYEKTLKITQIFIVHPRPPQSNNNKKLTKQLLVYCCLTSFAAGSCQDSQDKPPCLHAFGLYYTVLYYTILYYTILYYTILYYTILYSILYYTILYYTILYYTILYYTILYYTIIYYTIPSPRLNHLQCTTFL